MEKIITSKTFMTAIVFTLVDSQIFFVIPQAQAQHHPVSNDVSPELIATDEDGFIVEFTTLDFSIEESVVDEKPCQKIIAENSGSMNKPGWPNMPVWGAFFGIPTQLYPSLTILEAEPVTIPGSYEICPMETALEAEKSGALYSKFHPSIWDSQAYTLSAFTPEVPVELTSPAYLRSQRVVQVRFQPFQYNPASGELRYYPRILARINIPLGKVQTQSTKNTMDEGAFEGILRNSLLNYKMARIWRQQPVKSQIGTQFSEIKFPTLGASTYKLYIQEEGMYQVTYEDLHAAGADLSSLSTSTIQLFNNWVEVPLSVFDSGDGQFDPGDYILFYGNGINTKYTDQNIYFLTWNVDEGLRMSTMDGSVSGGAAYPNSFWKIAHFEEDEYYISSLPSGEDNDTWYWGIVEAANGPASEDFEFELNNVFSSTEIEAKVTGLLKGYYAFPYHRTRLFINGHLVDNATWDVGGEYSFEITFPQTYLNNGTNILTLECPWENGVMLDIVWMNWFEIEYPSTFAAYDNSLLFQNLIDDENEFEVSGFITDTIEVFDITDSTSVEQVVNASIQPDGDTYNLVFEKKHEGTRRYIALSRSNVLKPVDILQDNPSNLLDVSHGADYIVITYKDFSYELQPLVDHRGAQGFRTMLVDVEDIYDEFNSGIEEANAIRNFLAYAYENWQDPAPMIVLLVGSGSYDPKNNLDLGDNNLVLTYLEQVDNSWGETASDNRFVAVSGDDYLPDIYIGRLPVQTSDEAATAVAKILYYEQNPSSDNWNRQVLLVADNADENHNYPGYSDELLDTIPDHIESKKIYLGITHSNEDEARAEIISSINQGYFLINYSGDGSYNNWAEENLFDNTTVSSLENANKLPIVVSMAPFNGYFVYHSELPEDPASLAESLVFQSHSGAVATLANTGYGTVSTRTILNKCIFDAIFSNTDTRLGPAFLQAKLNIQTDFNGQELIDTFTLFGDPALVINMTQQQYQIFIPIVGTGG